MTVVFADAGYWIALLNAGDRLHEQARALAARMSSATIVTTHMVLAEVLDHFASWGARRRDRAVQLVHDLERNRRSRSSPRRRGGSGRRSSGMRRGPDQRWSLTDCASFLTMEERGIGEALAHDRDFEQAGFSALLRDDST